MLFFCSSPWRDRRDCVAIYTAEKKLFTYILSYVHKKNIKIHQVFGMEGSSKIRQRTIHGKLFESFTNEVTYP